MIPVVFTSGSCCTKAHTPTHKSTFEGFVETHLLDAKSVTSHRREDYTQLSSAPQNFKKGSFHSVVRKRAKRTYRGQTDLVIRYIGLLWLFSNKNDP